MRKPREHRRGVYQMSMATAASALLQLFAQNRKAQMKTENYFRRLGRRYREYHGYHSGTSTAVVRTYVHSNRTYDTSLLSIDCSLLSHTANMVRFVLLWRRVSWCVATGYVCTDPMYRCARALQPVTSYERHVLYDKQQYNSNAVGNG